jgi:site-specific DNA recombinase
MSKENSEYYYKLLQNDSAHQTKIIDLDTRIKNLEKQIDKCSSEIESQAKNLRLASETTKKYILEDIEKLAKAKEQFEAEKDELIVEKHKHAEDVDILAKARELIFSFTKLVNNLSYQEKSELIRKIVEKIFVLPNADGDDEVHIFIKGTPDEDYRKFFQKVPERNNLCESDKNSIFNTSGSICG